MDQNAFRSLLSAPRPSGSSADTGEGSGSRGKNVLGKAAPKRGWGLKAKDNKAYEKPSKTDKGKDDSSRSFQPRALQGHRKVLAEGGYKDRAALRRSGVDDEYKEVETLLTTWEEQARAAGADDEEIEKQRAYLGGDATHSILVKGLDRALLAARKAELAREDEGRMEEELEGLGRDLGRKGKGKGSGKGDGKDGEEEEGGGKGKGKAEAAADKLGRGFKSIGNKAITKAKDGKKRKKKVKAADNSAVETTGTAARAQESSSGPSAAPEISKASAATGTSDISALGGASAAAAVSASEPAAIEEEDDIDIFADAGEYDLGAAAGDDDSDSEGESEERHAGRRGRSRSRDSRYRDDSRDRSHSRDRYDSRDDRGRSHSYHSRSRSRSGSRSYDRSYSRSRSRSRNRRRSYSYSRSPTPRSDEQDRVGLQRRSAHVSPRGGRYARRPRSRSLSSSRDLHNGRNGPGYGRGEGGGNGRNGRSGRGGQYDRRGGYDRDERYQRYGGRARDGGRGGYDGEPRERDSQRYSGGGRRDDRYDHRPRSFSRSPDRSRRYESGRTRSYSRSRSRSRDGRDRYRDRSPEPKRRRVSPRGYGDRSPSRGGAAVPTRARTRSPSPMFSSNAIPSHDIRPAPDAHARPTRSRTRTRSPTPTLFAHHPSDLLARSPSPSGSSDGGYAQAHLAGSKLAPLHGSAIGDLKSFLSADAAAAKEDERKLKKAQWRARNGLGLQEGVSAEVLLQGSRDEKVKERDEKNKRNQEYVKVMQRMKKDESAGGEAKGKE